MQDNIINHRECDSTHSVQCLHLLAKPAERSRRQTVWHITTKKVVNGC